jgi:hypothetical protein
LKYKHRALFFLSLLIFACTPQHSPATHPSFVQAVLISNPHSTHRELITMLKARIQGHLDSTK